MGLDRWGVGVERLNLPPGIAVEDLGELALRGRDARLRAYALELP